MLPGLLGGKDSFPDRMRMHMCSNSGDQIERFHTYHNSVELASLIKFPTQEIQGFSLHQDFEYSVNFQQQQQRMQHEIGHIINNGVVSERKYSFDINLLNRHCAVLGITGSGKTTTIKNLLHTLDNYKIPFLVIEPTKNEYRHLLSIDKHDNSDSTSFAHIRVYTLGQENISPFRLNPFEFEMIGCESTYVLSHIDYLKSVSNSAFILYAPMPYILDISLHEIYEDKGWILSSGKNIRIEDDNCDNYWKYSIFPTFSDLYWKIEKVTKRFGYEERIEQNVIASLKARIDSLRSGSKGNMLDVSHGMSMKKLCEYPTILELQDIGNDEEKTFIMGISFIRLYEYLKIQTKNKPIKNELQHLTVIEEAHRLLQKINTESNTETSNLRVNSIETFNNMLSEIRHYGEGLLIADQIPNKLSSDVLKNTNLKVIHRLLAEDDRHYVAGSINVGQEESRGFSLLNQGEAIIFSEGDNYPYKIQVIDRHATFENYVNDEALTLIARNKLDLSKYFPIPDIGTYEINNEHYNSPLPIYITIANKITSNFK